MNKKNTFFIWALLLLISFGANAQTYVYNDSTSSGAWYQSSDGGEVANPLSDAVNASATCAQNGTDGTWQQIQYFPTYTPVSGDKLFFSIYNPNNTGPGQIQFRYSSDQSTWQFGANVTYTTESQTGWVEYTVDLSNHVGNEIDQVIIMPSGDNSAATFVDNIYFNDVSVTASTGPFVVYDDNTSSGAWYQSSDGGEVANPLSDSVNSSATCAQNGTDGTWQQIQYFSTYTPVSGDKLFFSIYNPNNTGPGQIQFRYSSDQSTWQFGANVTYTAESQTGWVEYSVDLSAHVGNEIDQVIMMPSGDNSAATYVDNVYFNDASVTGGTTGPVVIYDESTKSGAWYQSSDGGEVANPLSDGVNSSATCGQNGTDGNWQQIQYFITYTPVSGDKLFFSIYNPNNTGPGQIQFRYSSDQSTWQYGGDIAYTAASQTGWVEYSIDLSNHVGNLIDQVIMMPSGDNSATTYIDNVYFGNQTVLSTDVTNFVEEAMFINSEGRVSFKNDQNQTKLNVFDVAGRLIFKENINGKYSENTLHKKGVYILRIEKEGKVSVKKLLRR
ncbi:T9SS type A sorting domain-containing protein [Polaribacter litorisediminis]|uniref:T9SS type A sorting domain-containing protein n=1 Tax=Polaribacter litorisediminis TaxID=1908341 RepID=UPI001CC0A459|nr:T9SS type A sorting domain-containing protein [Polaribacter litorisediminis]UAM97994.1 T9SS type A sorting domain-containing protein [Polaribacter litorisediminis]